MAREARCRRRQGARRFARRVLERSARARGARRGAVRAASGGCVRGARSRARVARRSRSGVALRGVARREFVQRARSPERFGQGARRSVRTRAHASDRELGAPEESQRRARLDRAARTRGAIALALRDPALLDGDVGRGTRLRLGRVACVGSEDPRSVVDGRRDAAHRCRGGHARRARGLDVALGSRRVLDRSVGIDVADEGRREDAQGARRRARARVPRSAARERRVQRDPVHARSDPVGEAARARDTRQREARDRVVRALSPERSGQLLRRRVARDARSRRRHDRRADRRRADRRTPLEFGVDDRAARRSQPLSQGRVRFDLGRRTQGQSQAVGGPRDAHGRSFDRDRARSRDERGSG